jgi:hypothetical protein
MTDLLRIEKSLLRSFWDWGSGIERFYPVRENVQVKSALA